MNILRFLTCGCIGGRNEADTHASNATPSTSQAQRARSGSYGSAFYQPHNIIGSTGDVDDHPTVYYQSGQTFGHITTAHKKPDNVGKEKVRTHSQYSMANTGKGGVLQEKIGAKVVHDSRNPFVSVSGEAEREKLHQATLDHRNLKSRYVKK